MRRFAVATFSILLAGLLTASISSLTQSVLAAPASSPADATLAPERLAHISENCTYIKQALTQLQYADSRTRTYLGSSYETVANSFLSPINLRLVKNNLSVPALMNIQSDFSIAQTAFRNQYTAYMRDLETLIGTDCKAHPEEFATRLDVARNSRATLHTSAALLNQLISEQKTAVRELQEKLHD